MVDIARFAVALTGLGYACYPVSVRLDERGKKKPAFAGSGWQNGAYPTDPDAIRAHWDGFDGIALNTERSGLVVVDIDVKTTNGFEALTNAGVRLPRTPVRVRTPSGGMHLLYRQRSDIPVPTSQNKLADGVDIRAIGGIAFAPPTVVEGVGSYEFIDGAPVAVADLPEFPRDVAEALKPRAVEIHTADERPLLTFEQRQRMQARMDRILRDLATMRDGERNSTMRLRMIRLFGVGMTLGEDAESVAQLARDAYFESGGTAEHELESFIDWARKHARYELPEDETDEAFEAEVARLIRAEKVREEARARLSPLRVTPISDDDVIEFDEGEVAGDYWIHGLVPRGETVILFGPPNAGKSFAGIDLAMGVASGTEAWGRAVERQGRSLYLAGEGTRRLALRRRAWEVYHETTIGREHIEFRKMRLLVASDESVAQNRDLVNRGEFDLIIVDTLLRATEGLELENPGHAARAIAQLDRIREERPGATVVVLHHPPEGNQDKPSGSYPLRGNVDTILKVVNDSGVRVMTVAKSREDDTSMSASFELRDINVTPSLRSAVWVPMRHYY